MIQIKKILQDEKESLYYVQINGNLSFTLTEKQLKELYLVICQHLFNNLLEQSKDILMRLRNNEPVPKMLNSDRVINWMKTHGNLWPRVTIEINKVIDKFKQDCEL